jgi:hypothetical protein
VSSKCFQSGRLGLPSPFWRNAFSALSWTTSAPAIIIHPRALYREFDLIVANIGCLLPSNKPFAILARATNPGMYITSQSANIFDIVAGDFMTASPRS